jgi:hypothetical protein
MDISSISVSAAAQRPDSAEWKQRAEQAMAPVADLLGLTPDQLQQQLQSGQTLGGLASAKGISHSDLVSAIQNGLQAAAPAGKTPPAGLAEKIADGTVKHHHRHHHAAQQPQQDSTTTTQTDPTSASSLFGSSQIDQYA